MPLNYSDVFPSESEEIHDGDIVVSSMHYNTRPCKLCGAMILKSKMEVHIEFHNSLLTIKDM